MLSLGESDPLRLPSGLVDDDSHHLARTTQAALEGLTVLVDVDLHAGDARFHGRLCDGG